MRLWSLHPKYLDSKGLVALWREGLLARKVLEGGTKGYRNHPQLQRFRTLHNPVAGIDYYLSVVEEEARSRSYTFDRTKLPKTIRPISLPVTSEQMAHEVEHLRKKLTARDPLRLTHLEKDSLDPHPLFHIVPGDVEDWEKVSDAAESGPA